MPLLSIIIPVYNVAPYLDECLESVIGQDYSNVEIICVDDGSTDGSGPMLDAWSRRDERIVVIHEDNHGVSAARNRGIGQARGEYIAFVDADDKVCSEIFTVSLSAMGKHNLDVFIFAFSTFPDNRIETTGFKTSEVMAYHQLFTSNARIQTRNSLCFPWRFVFRTSILKANNLLFDERITIGEDMIFNIDVVCHSSRIMVTDKPLYMHRKNNPNSLMTRPYKPNLEDSISRMHNRKIEQLWEFGLNKHDSYIQDLAEYTILVYLRMLVENSYHHPEGKCANKEIRRLLSLPFIRNAFNTIGQRNIFNTRNEYLFFLMQKYRIMPVVMRVYNKLYR